MVDGGRSFFSPPDLADFWGAAVFSWSNHCRNGAFFLSPGSMSSGATGSWYLPRPHEFSACRTSVHSIRSIKKTQNWIAWHCPGTCGPVLRDKHSVKLSRGCPEISLRQATLLAGGGDRRGEPQLPLTPSGIRLRTRWGEGRLGKGGGGVQRSWTRAIRQIRRCVRGRADGDAAMLEAALHGEPRDPREARHARCYYGWVLDDVCNGHSGRPGEGLHSARRIPQSRAFEPRRLGAFDTCEMPGQEPGTPWLLPFLRRFLFLSGLLWKGTQYWADPCRLAEWRTYLRLGKGHQRQTQHECPGGPSLTCYTVRPTETVHQSGVATEPARGLGRSSQV